VFEINIVVSIVWMWIGFGSGGIMAVAQTLLQCRLLVGSLRGESTIQQKVTAHDAICMQVVLGNAATAGKRLATYTRQDFQLA
jgi:hypothetical protein